MKYTFSGHETFHCRGYWLKKGFDHVTAERPFNDSAVLDLGVGRNMVGSIRYWLRAFQILDARDQVSEVASKIFDEDGWDPFLEDEASLWLLHYWLVNSKERASIYHLIFGDLRKAKPEFTWLHFKNLALEKDPRVNENTLKKDFGVFVNTYLAKPSNDKEESYSGLLSELGLLIDVDRKDEHKNPFFRIENSVQLKMPLAVLLYCAMIEHPDDKSISFDSFFDGPDKLGSVFCFSKEELEQRMIEIASAYKWITYKNDSGVKELQLKKRSIDPIQILAGHYE